MTNKIQTKVSKIFEENKISYDYDVDEDRGLVEIHVEDGDWKHDHLRLKAIMQKNHFLLVCVQAEESLDDCYTAVYTFLY